MKKIRTKWKHIADSKRTRGSDASKLDKIQKYLNDKRYFTLTGETLAGRRPDLVHKYQDEKIVIELDGYTHGFGDEATESEQTVNRNNDYERNNIPFIPINESWCKLYGYSYEQVAHIGLYIIREQLRVKERFK